MIPFMFLKAGSGTDLGSDIYNYKPDKSECDTVCGVYCNMQALVIKGELQSKPVYTS